MALIGEEGLDLAILPIGDYYTMGPDDALRAVKLLKPRHVLPIHYNTFPPIAQDAARLGRAGQERPTPNPSSSSRVNGSLVTADPRRRYRGARARATWTGIDGAARQGRSG